MKRTDLSGMSGQVSAQPRLHQRASAIQSYGTVNLLLPLELEEPVRVEMTEQLNQLLGYDDASRPVQEIALAGQRPHFLSTPYLTSISPSRWNLSTP
jgi:hypothetical protein